MKKGRAPSLGERELDIMQALWRLGTASVAEAHAMVVADGGEVAYTTVQTMLNRLEAKGLVARDAKERTHRYRPLLEQPTVVRGAIQTLARRFFEGSREALAIHLVESGLTREQVARIRAILDAGRAGARGR
jgi:predicted transcriptional regulator